MAVSSYSTLKTEVATWLDRDDLTNVIDTWIDMFETRLYTQLRVRDMETAFSDTIASGVVSVPSGFLEWKNLYIDGSPIQPIELKSSDWIISHYPVRSSESKPVYAAMDAGTLIFGPWPDSAYTVKGTYYARPTALSTSNETNFLTTTYPDVLLYGVLVQSPMYVGQDERLNLWQAAYDDALQRMITAERMERFAHGMPLAAVAQ